MRLMKELYSGIREGNDTYIGVMFKTKNKKFQREVESIFVQDRTYKEFWKKILEVKSRLSRDKRKIIFDMLEQTLVTRDNYVIQGEVDSEDLFNLRVLLCLLLFNGKEIDTGYFRLKCRLSEVFKLAEKGVTEDNKYRSIITKVKNVTVMNTYKGLNRLVQFVVISRYTKEEDLWVKQESEVLEYKEALEEQYERNPNSPKGEVKKVFLNYVSKMPVHEFESSEKFDIEFPFHRLGFIKPEYTVFDLTGKDTPVKIEENVFKDGVVVTFTYISNDITVTYLFNLNKMELYKFIKWSTYFYKDITEIERSLFETILDRYITIIQDPEKVTNEIPNLMGVRSYSRDEAKYETQYRSIKPYIRKLPLGQKRSSLKEQTQNKYQFKLADDETFVDPFIRSQKVLKDKEVKELSKQIKSERITISQNSY